MNIVATVIVSFILASSLVVRPVFAAPAPTAAGSMEKPAVQVSVESPNSTGQLVEQKPEYTLPYPGILSDHPLYTFKMLRDWVMERLIVDPLRKAEFYILQADKHLAMALAFRAKGMSAEELDSAKKAEAFLEQAMSTALMVKTSGKDIPGHIVDRFERSTAKHLEVLTAMLAAADQARKAGVAEAVKATQQVVERIGKLK